MPLFDDQERESYGRFYADRSDPLAPSLSEVLTGDPLSDSFVVPAGDKPRDLVRYLIACQVRELSTSIVETGINEGALIRQAKLLLKDYSPETIKRAIKLASLWCPFTFSFKFVRERTIPRVEEWILAHNTDSSNSQTKRS